jgi:hypothetical protein
MSAQIFISYASQDQRIATTLCSALESRGFKCWIAARDIHPGENFQSAIVKAIRGAKIMLLVFTSNSNNSDEMNKELALASQSKLVVVPLRIEDVTPNDAFAYEFATRQWIDFFANWEQAIQQLVLRIEAAAEVAAAEALELNQTGAAPADGAGPAKSEATSRPAAEERSFAAGDADEATESDPEVAPRSGRKRLLVAAGVAAVVAVVLGVTAAEVLKPAPPKNSTRAMEVIRAVAPPQDLQKVSTDPAAAPDAAPPPEAAKPRPKRKMEKVRPNDVPF